MHSLTLVDVTVSHGAAVVFESASLTVSSGGRIGVVGPNEGLERLERFVQDVRGSVVVVSHDRAFLDRTVTGSSSSRRGRPDCGNGGVAGASTSGRASAREQLSTAASPRSRSDGGSSKRSCASGGDRPGAASRWASAPAGRTGAEHGR
jgi:ATPase subunit of ABC transporter with duplicated ATPase domains